MNVSLIFLGLWVRWIIIGPLFTFGIIDLTCSMIRLFYRLSPTLRRVPIWTSVIAQTAVLLALIAGLSWVLGWIGTNA